MKRKKKQWLMGVWFLLLLALAGCTLYGASGEIAPDPQVITLWHYYNGVQKEAFDHRVAHYNQTRGREKGIVVEASSQGGVNELSEALLDAIEGRPGSMTPPDLCAAYADTALPIYEKGLLVNMKPYLSQENLDQLVPSFLEEGQFEGEESLFLYPVAKSTEVLMLNKTDWETFTQATGAKEEALQSWEGVRETAAAYYEWTLETQGEGRAFFGLDSMANYLLIGSMQLETEMFHVKKGQVTLHLEEAVLRRLWEAYVPSFVQGHYTEKGFFRSDDARTGEVVAYIGSTSGSTYFPQNVSRPDGSHYSVEGKVLPLPVFNGGQRVAVQQGAGFLLVASEETRHQKALDFLSWFSRPEQNLTYALESGYLPVTREGIRKETLVQALESVGMSETLSAQVLETAAQMVEESRLYTNKPFQNGSQARKILNGSIKEWSQNGRQLYLASIQKGRPAGQALEEAAGEQVFQKWRLYLTEELESLMETELE